MIIRRVKGSESLGGGEGPLGKLSGIRAGEAARVLTSTDELLDIEGKTLNGTSGKERAGSGGHGEKVRPSTGEEGETPLTECGLTGGVIRGGEGPTAATAMETAAAAGGIGAGGTVEDSLCEKHPREEVEEGQPARELESRRGGNMLENNGGTMSKEGARGGGELTSSTILHELKLKRYDTVSG